MRSRAALGKYAGETRAAQQREKEVGESNFALSAGAEENWALISESPDGRERRRLDGFRANVYHQPEKMLVLAVLADAILCFQKYLSAKDQPRKRMFRDAKNWLWSDRNDWPFSYRNACDVLGFDAHYLRQGLLRWKQNLPLAKIGDGRDEPVR